VDGRRVVAEDGHGTAGAQLDEGVRVVTVGPDADPLARAAALLGAPEQVHLDGVLGDGHDPAAQISQIADPLWVAALDDDGRAAWK